MIASELMTKNVIHIEEKATIGQAVELLKHHMISGLPVIDGQGRLVGVITGGDVLRAFQKRAQKIYHFLFGPTHVVLDEAIWDQDRHQILDQPVSHMMSRGAVTVSPDTPIGEVVETMLSQSVRRVFVVANARLAGIITRNDVVRYLVSRVSDHLS